MATKSVAHNKRVTRFQLAVYGVLAVLLIVLVVREFSSFSAAWQLAGQANLAWLVAGFLIMLLSIPCTAMVYRALTPQALPLVRTSVVQAAGLFVNKLLPAGSGAIGVSYLYLRAQKVGQLTAAAVVTVNNSLGFVGHSLLLLLFVLLQPDAFHGTDRPGPANIIWVVPIVGGLAAALLLLWLVRGKAIAGQLQRFWEQIKPVVSRPSRLGRALLFSMLITLCYGASLLAATRALGLDLSAAQIMIALSFSVLTASVVPVPGGIGAAEAGIYLGLVAEGTSNETALASAVLFRVLSFWLPLVVGLVAFIFTTRFGYLKSK